MTTVLIYWPDHWQNWVRELAGERAAYWAQRLLANSGRAIAFGWSRHARAFAKKKRGLGLGSDSDWTTQTRLHG